MIGDTRRGVPGTIAFSGDRRRSLRTTTTGRTSDERGAERLAAASTYFFARLSPRVSLKSRRTGVKGRQHPAGQPAKRPVRRVPTGSLRIIAAFLIGTAVGSFFLFPGRAQTQAERDAWVDAYVAEHLPVGHGDGWKYTESDPHNVHDGWAFRESLEVVATAIAEERFGPVEVPIVYVISSSTSAVTGCDWACILCESGGNPQAVNPNGHWGLFQFDRETWAAHGGDPDDYGSAGEAEQRAVASRITYDAWSCN